jgi:hypothetical protein
VFLKYQYHKDRLKQSGFAFTILVNTCSTLDESPLRGPRDRTEGGNYAAALHAGSSQDQIAEVMYGSGLTALTREAGAG